MTAYDLTVVGDTGIRRLRWLLKRLGRDHGLRCVRVVEVGVETGMTPAADFAQQDVGQAIEELLDRRAELDREWRASNGLVSYDDWLVDAVTLLLRRAQADLSS